MPPVLVLYASPSTRAAECADAGSRIPALLSSSGFWDAAPPEPTLTVRAKGVGSGQLGGALGEEGELGELGARTGMVGEGGGVEGLTYSRRC